MGYRRIYGLVREPQSWCGVVMRICIESNTSSSLVNFWLNLAKYLSDEIGCELERMDRA